jgi:hypothetical protein
LVLGVLFQRLQRFELAELDLLVVGLEALEVLAADLSRDLQAHEALDPLILLPDGSVHGFHGH